LFECDLSAPQQAVPKESGNITIEQKNHPAELNEDDRRRIANAWNVELANRLHAERFSRGESLWLLKTDGKVAAYGWTIKHQTIEPHFYPLGTGDVHLFDFFVFPEFRGRRFNPFLVNHILGRLASEHAKRAFIEAAEWNTPQLTSLGRTSFRKLGCARKFRLFGKTIVVWQDVCS
jgi:GNAT superfamily N-acetyltransferase